MAVKTSELPRHAALRASAQRSASRRRDCVNKTFEELSPEEREALLKEMLIRMGYIQDSA